MSSFGGHATTLPDSRNLSFIRVPRSSSSASARSRADSNPSVGGIIILLVAGAGWVSHGVF